MARLVIKIWTDGAVSANVGVGGWAWCTESGSWDAGYEGPSATSQRMELTAALEALRHFIGTGQTDIAIVSDSAYLVNCFKDEWYRKWWRNDWRGSTLKPVANQDLWRPIIQMSLRNNVQYIKTKGHSTDEMNCLADRLAVQAKMFGREIHDGAQEGSKDRSPLVGKLCLPGSPR